MKRLARYKLNFGSRWLTCSGVMMGIAFFLQALDFFALRQLQRVDLWNGLLFLVLPMVLEALWCFPLRSESWGRAEAHGVFAAMICLTLLGQAILSGGVLPIVLAVVFCLLSGAVSVLVTWGFFPRKALGMLTLAATAAVRVLTVFIPRYVSAPGYQTLVQELPPICMILGMALFFGGIYQCRSNE